MILLALLTASAGVGLVLDPPKDGALRWIAVPLLAIGATLFAWLVWPNLHEFAGPQDSLAARFLRRVTLGGRLIPFFPDRKSVV